MHREMTKESSNPKQVSVRVPVALWRKCMHRMVDEERGGFQALIIEWLEEYANSDETAPPQRKTPLPGGKSNVI